MKGWWSGNMRLSPGKCVQLFFAVLLAVATLWAAEPAQAQSQAQATSKNPPAPGIDLPAITQNLDLKPNLLVLMDRDNRLTPQQALDAAGWTLPPRAGISPEPRSATLWVQFTVTNSSPVPLTRWMVIGSPRIESIDVFQMTAWGTITVAQRGGTGRPLAERPVPDRLSTFPVELSPGQVMTVLVRTESRPFIQMNIQLWEPKAWHGKRSNNDLALLLPIVVMLTLAISLIIISIPRRQALIFLMATWLAVAAIHELAFQGFLYRYLLTGGGEWAVRMPAITSISARVIATLLFSAILELNKSTGTRWIVRVVCGVFAALLGIAIWGDLRKAVELLNLSTAPFFILALLLLVKSWRERHPRAPVAVVGALTLMLANGIRILYYTGGIDETDLVIEPTLLYMIVGTLIVMFYVIRSAALEQRNAIAASEALLQLKEGERKRLEQAVEERTQTLSDALLEAREANRAKRDFLAAVSHDLRSPLTAIIGYAERIVAGGRQDAESARIIRRSARHLLSLLNDLIEYARSAPDGELQNAPIYTSVLLEAVASEGRALARRNGNTFDFRVGSALPQVVEADQKRLHQVLENLLSNAAKFTRHGHIQFSVEIEVGSVADLRVGSRVQFIFTVRDTGPGIPQESLNKIFEPFVRLPSAELSEGLGLGLSIVRQWVTRMGGAIETESALGQGTTMRVRIPLAVASEDALPGPARVEEEAMLPQLEGRGLSIWVAEDSKVIRDLLVDDLRAGGFDVLGFPDGSALMAHAADTRTPPALVLTDLQMQRADGIAVLGAVRRRWPGLPVVLLTAIPSSEATETRSFGGFSAVLQKPVSLSQLRQTLGGLLGLLEPLQADSDPGEPAPGFESPPGEPTVAVSLASIRPELQAQLRDMVRDCAISDIIDWADQLAGQDPASSAFALHARTLAEKTDLKSLAALCA